MPTFPELIAYALINYIPYMLLALLPFKDDFRFSKPTTAVLFLSSSVLTIFLFIFGYYLGNPWHVASSYVITLLFIAFYFLCVHSRWRRMLFNLFMIKNTANFVVIAAKGLEAWIFPGSIDTLYHWTNSLCMLIAMALNFPLVVYIVRKYFTKQIRDAINPTVWRFLWLIPVFFYVIWRYAFFYASDRSALELAQEPAASIFMTVYILGQLLIYICIAKQVMYFNRSALLEEENFRLSEQHLQYRRIQEPIQEMTRFKHDLRHHLITLNNYAEQGDYDALKEYLHKYMDTVPSQRISYCGNTALNLLLVYYSQKCRDENIDFRASLQIPTDLGLSDADVTVLFGNLLENAVDACMAIPDSAERFVSVNAKALQQQLVFVVENAYRNEFRMDDNGAVLSTKHDGYGIGTASVKSIVMGHDGTLRISPDGQTFSVSILLPFPKAQ